MIQKEVIPTPELNSLKKDIWTRCEKNFFRE